MSRRKKRKTPAEIAIEGMGSLLLEIFAEKVDHAEALEEYFHLLKFKVHFREPDFPRRLAHGFRLLKEEMDKRATDPAA